MKEIKSENPRDAGKKFQLPETVDEAETLLNMPFDRVQKSIALGWLLQHVGESEKAYRLYMAHRANLDALRGVKFVPIDR